EREYRILRPDGAVRWVRDDIMVSPLPDGGVRLDGVLSDVTRRKEAEKELHASEERYCLLFERNLAGVFRSTLDGRLLDCHDSFARILGYERRDDILGRPVAPHYFDPHDRDNLLDKLRLEGHLANHELRMRRCDTRPVWVLESVSLLREPDGE